MGCKINALLINPRDNVVVVMKALQAGDMAVYKLDDLVQQTAAITDVPIYHKLARSDIREGRRRLQVWRDDRSSDRRYQGWSACAHA